CSYPNSIFSRLIRNSLYTGIHSFLANNSANKFRIMASDHPTSRAILALLRPCAWSAKMYSLIVGGPSRPLPSAAETLELSSPLAGGSAALGVPGGGASAVSGTSSDSTGGSPPWQHGSPGAPLLTPLELLSEKRSMLGFEPGETWCAVGVVPSCVVNLD